MAESYDRQSAHTNDAETLREILRTDHLHRRTGQVATVVEYNHDCKTATIQIGIMMDLNGSIEPIAPISDVPVVFPRVGNRGISFPLQAGDEGAVVFADRAIGKWLDDGGVVHPDDTRIKHLSDAMFFPGINRACSDGFDGVEISGGDNANIQICENGLAFNANGQELISIIQDIAGSTTPPRADLVALLELMKC